jgi:4-carboxymuconolactone decarboxylase
MPTKLPIALVEQPTDSRVLDTFARLQANGGRPVNIHRTVAQSPAIFEKFVAFAWCLRLESDLKPAERELAIVRVLELGRGEYELRHHRRMAAAAGLSRDQIAALSPKVVNLTLFDDREAAILRMVDAFCSGGGVDDATQRDIKAMFSDRQIVELGLTLALYFGLAHFTNMLAVPLD